MELNEGHCYVLHLPFVIYIYIYIYIYSAIVSVINLIPLDNHQNVKTLSKTEIMKETSAVMFNSFISM